MGLHYRACTDSYFNAENNNESSLLMQKIIMKVEAEDVLTSRSISMKTKNFHAHKLLNIPKFNSTKC